MENFNQLVKQAKKGDKMAFAALYAQIYRELFQYACFVLRTKQDAEDAVSEAVADAFATIGKLKDEAAFKRWVFKILSCKCKKQLAAYYKKEACNLPLQADHQLESTDAALDMQTAMKSLSGEERMIVSLTALGGYNSAEVSQILKINRNTVRSKYARALEKLKKTLTQNAAEGSRLE